MRESRPFAILADATEDRPPNREEVLVRFADGRTERVRVQDYERVYRVPGLYEAIVVDELQCRSPDRVASMLARAARRLGRTSESVRVLDLGAGNGVSGEALAAHDLRPIVAIDVEPAARTAASRDRPGVYETYLTADVLSLTAAQRRAIEALELNALSCVGAIGMNHVPWLHWQLRSSCSPMIRCLRTPSRPKATARTPRRSQPASTRSGNDG